MDNPTETLTAGIPSEVSPSPKPEAAQVAQAKKAFNLAQIDGRLKSSKTHRMEIKTPAGEPTGQFINHYGRESEVVQDYLKEQANADFRADAARERRGEDAPVPTIEEMTERAIALFMVVVESIEGVILDDSGVPVESNATNIRKLLQIGFVRNQLKQSYENVENFM